MKKIVAVQLLVWISLSGCRESNTPVPEKPLIGITTAYREGHHTNVVSMNYVDAVLDSGGIPVVLPTIKSEDSYQSYGVCPQSFFRLHRKWRKPP